MAGEPILRELNLPQRIDPLANALNAYQSMLKIQESKLANKKSEAAQPFWSQNFKNDAIIKALSAEKNQAEQPYFQGNAKTSYEQALADLAGKNLGNQKTGIELETLPAKMQQELLKLSIENEYRPQTINADIGAKKAALMNAETGRDFPVTSGTAGQIAYEQELRRQGKTAEADFLHEDIERASGQKISQAQRDFGYLTAGQKEAAMAPYRSIPNITESEIQQFIYARIPPREAALSRGMSPEEANNLPSIFNLTSKNISNMHERQGAVAEEQVFNEPIREGIAFYRTAGDPLIGGVPARYSIDQALNKNRDKRIAYLVATMATMENAATQLKTAGLTGAVSNTAHALQLSGLNLPAPTWANSEDWKEAQKQYSELLAKGAEAYNNAATPNNRGTFAQGTKEIEKQLKVSKKLADEMVGRSDADLFSIARGEE